MQSPQFIKHTLTAPQKPEFLPQEVQWLAGEGAGSWFYIEKSKDNEDYEITRYSPNGKIECRSLFKIVGTHKTLDLKKSYKFTYLSHCSLVHIKQLGFTFKFVSNTK